MIPVGPEALSRALARFASSLEPMVWLGGAVELVEQASQEDFPRNCVEIASKD